MAQEYKFVYTPEEAAEAGVQGPEDLPNLIDEARSVPISSFNVGAAGLTSSGQVFLGVIVVFPNLPLFHCIHGEQFVVTNLALNSVEKLTHIAVPNTNTTFGQPCLDCRHLYYEMRNGPQIQALIRKPEEGIDEFRSLENLLPQLFGPDSHIPPPEGVPLLLEPRDNGLVLEGPEAICSDPENCSHLECRALAAANKSYARYRNCPSGVALMCEGEVYRGWFIETVAFGYHNPTSGPLHAALVDFVARGRGRAFSEITKVVLVEMRDAAVGQEAIARLVLNNIAPECDFNVVYCARPN